jgi:diguanylate cyclase (GGDEF)-like protein/putative nucleotidyltransferase with HDIG domain
MSSEAQHRSYPPRLVRYLIAVVAISVPVAAGAVISVATSTPTRDTLIGIALFTLASIVAELKPVPLDEQSTRSVSLAFVFLLAAQVLFGWDYAVLAAIAAMAVSQAYERVEWRRSVFNISVYALSAFLSAFPGFFLGWDSRELSPTDHGHVTVLVFAGGVVFLGVNVFLIANAVSLATGSRVRPLLEDYVRHAGPAFAIMAFIAALAASLWRISAPLELLLAGPVIALGLYQRYAYRSVLAKRDAETDALTGLRNHRAFHHDLKETLVDAEGPLALVVLDIDDFKGVNDRFGHPVGDEVLQLLARTLGDVIDAERCYRVGGEEFAALLDGDGEAAYALVDRLHGALAAVETPHGEPVTVSVGIAVHPDTTTDREELLRAADGALYWSKNHGRARTCVYEPSIVHARSRQEIAQEAERMARLRAAESLIRVVDAKDTYTGQHSLSVSRVVEGIAREMELPAEQVEQLRLAGLLHDLGKIAIPDRILQKPGALDEAEQAALREHPEIGYRLVEGAGIAPVDLWIRHHHEAWDGSGYPDGLAGDQIPLGSRIILVADAYDAMTSDRAYRDGGSPADAIAELRRCAWTQFDARVVTALEAYILQLESGREVA